MATPYASAIKALEEEITALTAALQLLRRRHQDHHQNPITGTDFSGVKTGRQGPTNEEAVGTILEAAHPQYLGTSRIVDLGPTIGGRELNVNSVRWVLKNGWDSKIFDKKKENGRVTYRINM